MAKQQTPDPKPIKATGKTNVAKRNFYAGKIPQKEIDAAVKRGPEAEQKLYMQYHNTQKQKKAGYDKAKKEGKI